MTRPTRKNPRSTPRTADGERHEGALLSLVRLLARQAAREWVQSNLPRPAFGTTESPWPPHRRSPTTASTRPGKE
jgi:hypothetical protein